jgi:hypothetical protein
MSWKNLFPVNLVVTAIGRFIGSGFTFPLNFNFNEYGITLLTLGEQNDEGAKAAAPCQTASNSFHPSVSPSDI